LTVWTDLCCLESQPFTTHRLNTQTMKITNISGAFLPLGLGRRVGTELAIGASKTVDDEPETVAAAVDAANKGLISIDEPPKGAQLNFVPAVPGTVVVAIGAPADEELLTIGTEVFEIDDDDTFTDGNTQIDTSVDSDSIDIADALLTEINANATLSDAGIVARETIGGTDPTAAAYLVIEFPAGTAPSDYTATGDTGMVVTKTDASSAAAVRMWVARQTATADEELVVTPFTTITEYLVLVQATGGAYKAYNGTVSTSGGSLFLNSAGTADIAATDELVLLVFGF